MEKNTTSTSVIPESTNTSGLWRKRLPILLILASFIVPAIAAFLLLKLNVWQNLGHTEKGLLVQNEANLQSLFSSTHPTWKLIYIAESTCSTPCQLALMQLRQIHKALGVEQSRVEYWLLPSAAPDAAFQQLISSTFADMHISPQPTADQLAWFNQTSAYQQQANIHNWVWVIDPLGQVVTAYPTYTDMQAAILAGKKILQDIKHLLKLSRVG